MPCYHPLRAWRTPSGSIVFVERADTLQTLDLPCGRCVGCRLERSRKWATRCIHEAQLHEHNAYVTLTYDDVHLPKDYSLHYRDFQLFIKRIRKEQKNIRYYMCGEYGEENKRPHYHAILFGAFFPDQVIWKQNHNGNNVYRSATLDRLWQNGFCTVGEVTYQSAAYVARYVMKKVNGNKAEIDGTYRRLDTETGEVFEVVPEFNKMSLKPGIGTKWLDKYHDDVYPHDFVVINGMKTKPPRYYDQIMERKNPDLMEDVKYKRYLDGREALPDNSYERLDVKEQVTQARIKSLKRGL